MVVLPVINFLLDALTRVMRCPVNTSNHAQLSRRTHDFLLPTPNCKPAREQNHCR